MPSGRAGGDVPNGHDHRLGGEAEVNDACPGRRSSRLNAVVTRMSPSLKRADLDSRQPSVEGGGASIAAHFREVPQPAKAPQTPAERRPSGRRFTHKSRRHPKDNVAVIA